MPIELIETFFNDLSDYMRFFLELKETGRATPDNSCIATLKKEDGKYLYILQRKDGRWVGEYVRPFRANEENLRLFHAGCAEVARRLRTYLETGQIVEHPPAFGILSFESSEAPPEPVQPESRGHKYFPTVEDAKMVKRFDLPDYTVILLTAVKCRGIIQCDHLLAAFRKGEREPVYVVASEVNNLKRGGSGSHFLGCYPGDGHKNLGCSDDWADLALFEREACRVMGQELNIELSAN